MCPAVLAQKVWPKLNLQKNKHYINNSTVTGKVIQTINGQPLEIITTIKSKVLFTVISITDSLYSMQVQYDSLSLRVELPNADLNFSAEKPSEKDFISAILSKIKGQPFRLTLSSTGRIISVDSIESIIKKAADNLSTIPADQRQQAAAQVTEAFGTAQFKATITASMQIYPPAPVAKAEVWEIDNIAEGRIKTARHILYNINQVTPQAYIIQGSAMINTIETDTGRLNGMPVKYRLSGLGNARLTVDKVTGWVNSATIIQNLKGNAEILHNPNLPGGMLIPMTVTNTISVSNK